MAEIVSEAPTVPFPFVVPDIAPEGSPRKDATVEEHLCVECGTPIIRKGNRGRWPTRCEDHTATAKLSKTRSDVAPASNPKGNVKDALGVLDAWEEFLSIPLMLVSPDAAQIWEARDALGLAERKRKALEASPDLAARIAHASGPSGVLGLAVAYSIALAPVVPVAKADINLTVERFRKNRK